MIGRRFGSSAAVVSWTRYIEMEITPIDVKLDRAKRHCARVAKERVKVTPNIIRCRRKEHA